MEVHSFHSEGLCLMLALIERRIGRMLYRANTKRQRKAVAVQKLWTKWEGKTRRATPPRIAPTKKATTPVARDFKNTCMAATRRFRFSISKRSGDCEMGATGLEP